MNFTNTPLQMLLRRLEAVAGLPEEDRQAILALPHRTRTVEASTYLTREGDLPTVCGVIGSIGYAFANPAGVGAWGASGGVFGLIGGALRMATPRGPILPLTDRRVLIQAGAWAAISVFVGVIGLGAGGTGAGIAWEAHLAGLAAGLLLVGPFVRLFPDRRGI